MGELLELYKNKQGKVSDKWGSYLREYDRLFYPFKDQSIRLLEIGIQNGGSLEVWAQYFSKGEQIIGCDIHPECSKLTFDDSRIKVVVGDATQPEVQAKILEQSHYFDLIIDDGSHNSEDIIRSFLRYLPCLKEGGLYVVEDLHCSYWGEYQGGLYFPYSSIAFFKRLSDLLHQEHFGISLTRVELLSGFAQCYSLDLSEECLASIHSLEFINSLCIIKKCSADANRLGLRYVVGNQEIVYQGNRVFHGAVSNTPNQADNPWSNLIGTPEDLLLNSAIRLSQSITDRERGITKLSQDIKERDREIARLHQAVLERDTQIARVHRSYSWRITKLFRFISRLVRVPFKGRF